MKFPEREQRHHMDIHPGLMFYFVDNPNARSGPVFTDPDPEFDKACAWMVIGKEYVEKMSGGWWRYLLLGAGPTLKWHEGQLGWIRRVADPAWEELYNKGCLVG